METKHKALYDSPKVTVVELKMESGVLTVSTNSLESREDGGVWGSGDWF